MRKRRWEQRFNLRPAQKSMSSRPRRARYTQAEVDAELLESMQMAKMLGMEIGRRQCDDDIQALIDAIKNRTIDDLVRQTRADDDMDLAEAAGVTPAAQVGDDAEQWLASRDAYLRMLHDEERAAGRRCAWQCWRCNVDGDG